MRAPDQVRRKPVSSLAGHLTDHGIDHASQGTGSSSKPESTAESLLGGQANADTSKDWQWYKRAVATWWQEVLAALMLCAAAIASFATLYHYRGKPLPDWPRAITIGALLSTYSVVLRLAATFLLGEGLAQLKWRWFWRHRKPLHDLVLHDSATRGPIGALRLLWRLPAPVTWQWLGCTLVIFALLTGPFTQQMLQYEPCSVPAPSTNDKASIARTSMFYGQGAHSGAGTISLTIAEQAAVNIGIYTPGTVGADCSTGNCTFPSYASAGYCSQCDDVSSSLQFNHTTLNTTGWSVENVTSYIPSGGLSISYLGNQKSYTTANYAVAGFDHSEYTSMGFTTIIGATSAPYGVSKRASNSPCDDSAMNHTWQCQGYAAASCAIFPCVREYTAEVVDGAFKETIESTWDSAFGAPVYLPWLGYAYAAINKSCLSAEEAATAHEYNFEAVDDGLWLGISNPSNDESNFPSGPDLEDLIYNLMGRGCIFAVSQLFDSGFNDYIGDSWSGNLVGKTGALGYEILSFSGPQLLQTVYNFGNYSRELTESVFENISLSLTNHMRLNSGVDQWYNLTNATYRDFGVNKAPVIGEASVTKTCLKVQWEWLALPVALVVLTLIFFAGVLLSSGGLTHDVRTWKSSPLPLLYYSFLDRDSDSAALSNSIMSQHISDLNSVAKKTNVDLDRDENGLMGLRRRAKSAHNGFDEI